MSSSVKVRINSGKMRLVLHNFYIQKRSAIFNNKILIKLFYFNKVHDLYYEDTSNNDFSLQVAFFIIKTEGKKFRERFDLESLSTHEDESRLRTSLELLVQDINFIRVLASSSNRWHISNAPMKSTVSNTMSRYKARA